MQYIHFENLCTTDDVKRELTRLVSENFITAEQAEMIDVSVLMRFFQSEIGKKFASSKTLLREFKFSVLDDAEKYITGIANEKILLQGVVDCAMLESDGITIIDFKTDKVSPETIVSVSEQYSSQVKAYASALQKIYSLPIKAAWLYYFHTDQFVEVDCQ